MLIKEGSIDGSQTQLIALWAFYATRPKGLKKRGCTPSMIFQKRW